MTDKWIPVSERLPEIKNYGLDLNFSETVLVTTLNRFGMNFVKTATLNWQGWDFEAQASELCEVVVAWMPLPKPYKAKGGKHDKV